MKVLKRMNMCWSIRQSWKRSLPKSSKVMDILQFVKAEEFDPVFMDKSYHVLPDGDITKPYALLRESMKNASSLPSPR